MKTVDFTKVLDQRLYPPPLRRGMIQVDDFQGNFLPAVLVVPALSWVGLDQIRYRIILFSCPPSYL